MNNSHKILAEKYQTIQEQTGKPVMKMDEYGNKRWYLNGEFHRTDGPAIEWADGSKEWWINGERHRTDGPAIEYSNGNKAWFLNGEFHRTDGPAIERANGTKEWYLNGKEYTEEEFLKQLHGKDLMDLAY